MTTGQRKYGGPPPESVYSGAQPTIGTEVRSLPFSEQTHMNETIKHLQIAVCPNDDICSSGETESLLLRSDWAET